MKTITVNKKDKILKGNLKLPASKSLSNRLLVIHALSKDKFRINNLSESDDTLLLQDLFQEIRSKRSNQSFVELDSANAGTVMRFLTAYLTMIPGKLTTPITGTGRTRRQRNRLLSPSGVIPS